MSRILRGLTHIHSVSPVCSSPSLVDADLKYSFLRMEDNTNIALEAGSLRTWPRYLCAATVVNPYHRCLVQLLFVCLPEPTASAALHSIDALFVLDALPWSGFSRGVLLYSSKLILPRVQDFGLVEKKPLISLQAYNFSLPDWHVVKCSLVP